MKTYPRFFISHPHMKLLCTDWYCYSNSETVGYSIPARHIIRSLPLPDIPSFWISQK